MSKNHQSIANSDERPDIFLPDELIKRTMGNIPFAQKLVTSFLNDFPQQLSVLQISIEKTQTEATRKQAHKMKGALGNLGANLLYQKMWQLEKACKNNNSDRIAQLATEIPQDYEALQQTLEKWLHENIDS